MPTITFPIDSSHHLSIHGGTLQAKSFDVKSKHKFGEDFLHLLAHCCDPGDLLGPEAKEFRSLNRASAPIVVKDIPPPRKALSAQNLKQMPDVDSCDSDTASDGAEFPELATNGRSAVPVSVRSRLSHSRSSACATSTERIPHVCSTGSIIDMARGPAVSEPVSRQPSPVDFPFRESPDDFLAEPELEPRLTRNSSKTDEVLAPSRRPPKLTMPRAHSMADVSSFSENREPVRVAESIAGPLEPRSDQWCARRKLLCFNFIRCTLRVIKVCTFVYFQTRSFMAADLSIT